MKIHMRDVKLTFQKARELLFFLLNGTLLAYNLTSHWLVEFIPAVGWSVVSQVL